MKSSVGTKIGAGFALALLMLVMVGVSSYRNTSSLLDAAEWRSHTSCRHRKPPSCRHRKPRPQCGGWCGFCAVLP